MYSKFQVSDTLPDFMSFDYFPERIVCLTEETTELLYVLGEQDRIVGISGFTKRPPEARAQKPRVSTFLDAKFDEIFDLNPDLVIGFSDIQAPIAKELISRGVPVWVNNHRSVDEIFKFMVQLGALVGKQAEAITLVEDIQTNIKLIQQKTENWSTKPTVYFEEWDEPIITGIRWVTEIIELAGGVDIFPELKKEPLAKNRIIEFDQVIIDKNPDVILASWCGKKFKKKKMLARPGWEHINAVKNDQIFEINSDIILQPGPASVTEGFEVIHQILEDWVQKHG